MSSGAQIAGEQTATLNRVSVKTIFSRALKAVSDATYHFIKRAFDIFFGLVGCACVLPLAAMIKIAYLIDGDHASIFFVQERIGRGGGMFKLYKFRTMVPDAEAKLKELLANDAELAEEYSQTKKLRNDPRITRFGGFLRKTSLDEFPQFWNVLKGEMSLIGNRPYMLQERDEVSERLFERLVSTKPGISGYWQTSGRSNLSFDERVRLERFYSDNANFFMDSVIFFKTFSSVLSQEGAD